MNEEADKTSETIVTRSRLQTSDVNLKAFNDHNNVSWDQVYNLTENVVSLGFSTYGWIRILG